MLYYVIFKFLKMHLKKPTFYFGNFQTYKSEHIAERSFVDPNLVSTIPFTVLPDYFETIAGIMLFHLKILQISYL